MQQRKILLLIGVILLLALACNLNTSAPQSQATQLAVNPGVATAVEETLRASNMLLSTSVYSPTPTFTPSPTLTPTPSSTPTPAIPMVSVSLDTNCRSGPGKAYDYLGALLIGEKAEMVGKHTGTNYWIIKNPDHPGNCWLWGQYATITGNTANLQEYAVPATPTPTIPIAPSNLAIQNKVCGTNMEFTLTWTDNSTNEEGFSLYQDNTQTHIIGYNITSVALSVPFTDNQPIEFALAAYNTTGKSAKQVIQVVCP